MHMHVWMRVHAHTHTCPGTVVRVLHILIHLILTATKWARYEWGKEPLKYVIVITQLKETHNFFFNFIFKLYNIVLVLPNIEMNPPQVYMCSPSWTLLPPPSPYHPSVSSQCTSPKHPVSFIKPGLATCFIHGIIRVSMPFSQIFPPLPLPQSPKDCSIYQCLFCCLVYRVIVTIFLNSIYMR